MEQKSLKYLKRGFIFLFFHIYIGRIDCLPDFVGALFLFYSIQSHREQTPVEERVKSLFLVLAADYFLNWIFPFDFVLENLLMAVISIYATFVLLGEVAVRIREEQPERAKQLDVVRVLTVIFQVVMFMVSAYEIEYLNGMLIFVSVGVLIAQLVVVCKIEPAE